MINDQRSLISSVNVSLFALRQPGRRLREGARGPEFVLVADPATIHAKGRLTLVPVLRLYRAGLDDAGARRAKFTAGALPVSQLFPLVRSPL